MRQTMIILNL